MGLWIWLAACTSADDAGICVGQACEDTDPGADTDTDPPAPSGPRVRWMLHGGGPEDDAIFQRFVEEAGYGRIVTLGALEDPDDPDLRFWDGYFESLGAREARTFNSTGPPTDATGLQVVAKADAVFFRGGDQSRYVSFWWGNELGAALEEAWDNGAVFGGSSAGCAILGERVHDAMETSVDAWDVLYDGADAGQTFTPGLRFGVPGVLTDTHFTERGRQPRLAVFLGQWAEEGRPDGLGIGVDPETALFLQDDGLGEIMGPGTVTLMRVEDDGFSLDGPPDLRARFWQLPAGYTVDIDAADPVLGRPAWVVQRPDVRESVVFVEDTWSGDDPRVADAGSWRLAGADDAYAWRDGLLELPPGEDLLPGLLMAPRLYADPDLAETRVGGLWWAVGRTPGMVGIGLDEDAWVTSSHPRLLETGGEESVIVLDGRAAGFGGAALDGWQASAIEGMVLELVPPGRTIDLSP